MGGHSNTFRGTPHPRNCCSALGGLPWSHNESAALEKHGCNQDGRAPRAYQCCPHALPRPASQSTRRPCPLPPRSFLVLVGGTLLYSKGDEKRVQEHLEEEKEFYSEIAGGSEEAAAEGVEANGGEGAAAAGEGDDGLPEVRGLRREGAQQ